MVDFQEAPKGQLIFNFRAFNPWLMVSILELLLSQISFVQAEIKMMIFENQLFHSNIWDFVSLIRGD